MLRGLIAGIAVLLVAAPSASALDPVDTQAIRAAVSVNRILRHERALQGIAFMNGGSRVAGSPGHAASVAYFRDVLATAGYRVREQEFAFPYFELRARGGVRPHRAGSEDLRGRQRRRDARVLGSRGRDGPSRPRRPHAPAGTYRQHQHERL